MTRRRSVQSVSALTQPPVQLPRSGRRQLRTTSRTTGSTTPLSRVAFFGLIAWVVWTTTYLFPGAALVATIAIGAAAGDRLFSGRLPDIGGRTGIWLLAFAAVAVLTTGASTWLGRSVEELQAFLKLILIFFLVVNAATTTSRIRWLLAIAVVLVTLYPGRGGIVNYITGNLNIPGRAEWRGAFGNANALAALILLFLPFPYVWLRQERRRLIALLWGGCVVVLGMAILLTKSRSGFLGLAMLVIWAIWSARNRVRAAGLALALAIGVLAAAPEGWQERMSTIGYTITGGRPPEALASDVGSSESRLQIWRTALRIVWANPITGTGLGTFEDAHSKYRDNPERRSGGRMWRDAHNSFLRVWTETGIFGIITFLGLLGVTFRQGLRALRLVHARGLRTQFESVSLSAGLMGLAAFLVTNLFNTFTNLWFIYWHLAIVVTLTRACERAADARPQTPVRARRLPHTGPGQALARG